MYVYLYIYIYVYLSRLKFKIRLMYDSVYYLTDAKACFLFPTTATFIKSLCSNDNSLYNKKKKH